MNYLDFNFFSDHPAVHSHHVGHILHISGSAPAFLCTHCARLHILPIYRHLLLVLLQGSGVDEGKC